MKVAIVKYNAGNVRSVVNCLNRFGINPVVTDDSEVLKQADRVIFPGVGEAGSAMTYLRERGLDEVIRSLKCPVLGICLGLQLMCSYSEENDTECMGIFDLPVRKFSPVGKVPHTGWNTVKSAGNKLIGGFGKDSYFYFVHSYFAELSEETKLVCNYFTDFSAGLHKKNFYGVQFHPEKSGRNGEFLIRKFLIGENINE